MARINIEQFDRLSRAKKLTKCGVLLGHKSECGQPEAATGPFGEEDAAL